MKIFRHFLIADLMSKNTVCLNYSHSNIQLLIANFQLIIHPKTECDHL